MASLGERKMKLKALSAECAYCQVSRNRSLKLEQDQRAHSSTTHQSWNSMQPMLETMSFIHAQENLHRWRQSSLLFIGVNQITPKMRRGETDKYQENESL